MNRFFKTVLLTGLFVGTTDLVAAFVTQLIYTGKFAERMLKYIAGGALGLGLAAASGLRAASGPRVASGRLAASCPAVRRSAS